MNSSPAAIESLLPQRGYVRSHVECFEAARGPCYVFRLWRQGRDAYAFITQTQDGYDLLLRKHRYLEAVGSGRVVREAGADPHDLEPLIRQAWARL